MPTPRRRALSDLAGAAGDLLVRVDRPIASAIGQDEREAQVSGLAYDSSKVAPGDLFFCIPGARADGHAFAAAAAEAGAAALCVERPVDVELPCVVVRDARRALGRLAAAFYGDPAADLLLLGVTGTNGKTTTTFLIDAILRADGRTTGLVGTIETRIAGAARPGVRTTPESLDLHALFAEMVDAGVDSVAMEVTSHALALHRVEGLRFAAAAFTNLTQDHLDFHDSMEDYFEAKRQLFVPERLERGAVNVDEVYGRRLLEVTDVPCVGFGLAPEADVRAVDVELGAAGSTFRIATPKGEVAVESSLAGSFNVSNCLAATATCLQAGIGLDAIETGLSSGVSVPGRFESVDAGQPFSVVVDYAHTPDSLDNVLRAARGLAERGGGRVIALFGCGGDRDRGKRPLMGAVAARLADFVVVTSDNPRSEEPRAIVDEILEGVVAERADGPDVVDVDRRAAIAAAVAEAGPADVVVIAGKGHETGQQFRDHTIPFDDRAVAREELERLLG
ncbi:MAG TPA: UDP-N-acetylmuramoyl-L-alanyl-D-glutamate--2,6-diaminopimelate ligase [Actinomycetota bacterium]|nr:UDP-N-acetylmuramoyl-L-alanyl-D-glutamate--2,6-diaminopimelate ligase [Actinomycetota bacterium]